jgi:hypothetical protein
MKSYEIFRRNSSLDALGYLGGGKRRRNKLKKAEDNLCSMCMKKGCGNTITQKQSCSGVCGCPQLY